ncbi:MAG: O-antigen ligase family protein [Deltaproteobacteria bacterium]|nr:O-antigen ligase family protein [Deltaproteobacteria bacterium]
MPSHLIHVLIISSLFAATLFSPPVYFWSPILQVILLCWGLFLFFYDGVKKGGLEIKRSSFPLPLLIFFVLAVLYTFKSIDYALSCDFFFQLVSYVAIFFLIAQISSPREARRIALAIVILGILTSLYGLYQYLWGFQNLIDKIGEGELSHICPLIEEILGRLEGGRVFATFLLPSHFAAFLGMSILLSIAFIIIVRKGWRRYLFGMALGLQIFALYLTKSFSGWGSLILACGCFAFIYLGYVKRPKIRYLAYSLGGLVLLLALIFAGLTLKRPDNPFAPIKSNPLVLRVLNWETTIDMIRDEPWVGKGLNTFGLIYPSYQRPGVNIVHHSHNTYLQLGVEMGVVGMMAFLWFACWWFWRSLLVLKETEDRESTVWVGSVMVAGLAFFLHHAFDFEFYLPNVTLAGFAVLALAIGAKANDRVYRIALEGRRKTIFTFLGFAGVVAVSIVLLLQLYGQMHYQRATCRLESGSFFANEAALELKRAIRLDSKNSQYHHRYGVLLFQKLSRHKEGISEVQEAIRLSPWRHYYHFDLGMMYLISGQEKKGVEEIKRASQLYPLNEEYHQFLRGIYLQRGENNLAYQEEKWIERIQRQEGVD